ncbi:hypothetical protein HID58_071244, partial [Brassica napus]
METFVFVWLLLIFFTHLASSLTQDFSFIGFKKASPNLIMSGVTEIASTGAIRLTTDTSRVIGHAFYSLPIRFKPPGQNRALSFSTSFVIAMVPEYVTLGGHGLAFTITPTPNLQGSLSSQYLGILNSSRANVSSHFFAVEFDTVKDLEFEDINDNHVGIDINSLESSASTPAAYFLPNSTKKELFLDSGRVIQAWIDYDSNKKRLDIKLSPLSEKPKLSLLSYNIDLSSVVGDEMYVGFSASTGLLASSHYILGWNFNMSGEALSLSLPSLPRVPRPLKKKKSPGLILGVSLSCSLLVIAGLVAAVMFGIKKVKDEDRVEEWELDFGPHRFSYKELKKATNGFADKELLGSGGFGKVYKGKLPDSEEFVAVKRISHESRQGVREFMSEVSSIGHLRHRNLVQLLGWCRRRQDLLLVYDFMPNGSLDMYLFGETPKVILTWDQRFKIIKGVASALLYLHEGWEQTVIHRDIKAANVLLDGDMNGRVGDFGLAKLYEHGSNPGATRVVGTFGYLAPELTKSGKLTTSTDVYAFGALLLEVACGRRPIETNALPEELVMVDWVWSRWQSGDIRDVVDRRLNSEYDEDEVVMVIKLGLLCSNNSPEMQMIVCVLMMEAVILMLASLRTLWTQLGFIVDRIRLLVRLYSHLGVKLKPMGDDGCL